MSCPSLFVGQVTSWRIYDGNLFHAQPDIVFRIVNRAELTAEQSRVAKKMAEQLQQIPSIGGFEVVGAGEIQLRLQKERESWVFCLRAIPAVRSQRVTLVCPVK
jgi:hypothetical protein